MRQKNRKITYNIAMNILKLLKTKNHCSESIEQELNIQQPDAFCAIEYLIEHGRIEFTKRGTWKGKITNYYKEVTNWTNKNGC